MVNRKIPYYNLDMIISLGYRIKSSYQKMKNDINNYKMPKEEYYEKM